MYMFLRTYIILCRFVIICYYDCISILYYINGSYFICILSIDYDCLFCLPYYSFCLCLVIFNN